MNGPACPGCGSERTVKNGHLKSSKQRFLCRVCQRQFVLEPLKHPIDPATKQLVDKLLVERLSLRGICRAVGVSRSWLARYLKQQTQAVQQQVEMVPAKKVRTNHS
ncbi:IS1/IS1595 family N-terminal zinc-binding domain-containing protein [Deinococcus peraridilitoris]|uniref:IS1/IS1595 family N-terminal zinc-binding domain-containing protein n=1 Tax=Deinococcus peraridilitoris TaxID=432329 RepID=UPI00059D6F5D